MKEDTIFIEVLPDGTIRSTTPRISAANHSSASEFFKFLTRLTCGATSAKSRSKETHTHSSEHSHDHQHGGH